MDKKELINKLTLQDTMYYRNFGLIKTGAYKHEPVEFRSKLAEVYEKLDVQDIYKLLNLKSQEDVNN